MTTIIQADRDAAAELLPFADEECGECERGLMRAGEMDDHWLVQLLARHRAAGFAAGAVEGAKAMQDASVTYVGNNISGYWEKRIKYELNPAQIAALPQEPKP